MRSPLLLVAAIDAPNGRVDDLSEPPLGRAIDAI